MPGSDEILINELLMQREEQFNIVYDLEQEIEKVLGFAIEFEMPVKLPSQEKRKKVRKPTKERPKPTFKLPALKDDEFAYQITYQSSTESIVERHIDPSPLETLVQNTPKSIRIQKIETIDSEEISLKTLYPVIPG